MATARDTYSRVTVAHPRALTGRRARRDPGQDRALSTFFPFGLGPGGWAARAKATGARGIEQINCLFFIF